MNKPAAPVIELKLRCTVEDLRSGNVWKDACTHDALAGHAYRQALLDGLAKFDRGYLSKQSLQYVNKRAAEILKQDFGIGAKLE